jgi:hypothetical protein
VAKYVSMRMALDSLDIDRGHGRANFALSTEKYLAKKGGNKEFTREHKFRDYLEQLVKLAQHNTGKEVGKDVFQAIPIEQYLLNEGEA